MPAYVRIPLKLLVFAAVCFVTLFPYPRLFARHCSHVFNLPSMIEPNAPELAAFDAPIHARLDRLRKDTTSRPASLRGKELLPREIQKAIQDFVYDTVNYEWDWNLWGMADYMPTVGEMFEKSKEYGGKFYEDCDGRAVMAASLMRRFGYNASIVTDFRHVWVTTPESEWMGPGVKKAVVATSQGTEYHPLSMLLDVPISLSFGIAVFPLLREMIILVAAYLLCLHQGMSWQTKGIGLVLLIQGLLFMRLGYFAPRPVARDVSTLPVWIGLLHVIAGFAVLFTAARKARRRLRPSL